MVARLDMIARSRSRRKAATPENWARTQAKRQIARKMEMWPLPHFTSPRGTDEVDSVDEPERFYWSNQNHVVCEKHFDEKYISRRQKYRLKMKMNPVRSIYSRETLKRLIRVDEDLHIAPIKRNKVATSRLVSSRKTYKAQTHKYDRQFSTVSNEGGRG